MRFGPSCLFMACTSIAIGCGESGPAPSDAGSDAGAGLTIAPPAPPALTPCAVGWREVVDAASGVTLCDPWPEGGSASATCAPEEAHFPGTPGCAPIGSPCAADGWPTDLPTGRTVVYVDDDAAAGGDGSSPTLAFRTLRAGLAATPLDGVVALAAGRYDEESLTLRGGQTIWGACVADTQLTSRIAGDYPLLIMGGRAAGIRNLAIDMPNRIAIGVMTQDATIDDVVVRGARFALFVFSGSVSARHVAMKDSRAEADGSEGRAVDVGNGAHVLLDTVVIERNPQFGIWVGGAGSVVEARDLAVLDITPVTRDANTGRALYADDGARFELERVVLERSAGTAMFLHGAGTTAQATQLVIRDVRSNAAGDLGHGIGIYAGAQAMLDHVLVASARNSGMSVAGSGSEAVWRDGAILDTQSIEVSGRYGRGVVANEGAHVVLERLEVFRAHEAGLLAGLEGTRVELSDVRIRDTLPSERDGDWGAGIWVQDGAELSARRVSIQSVRLSGVISLTGARVDLEDASVVEVLPPDCATTTCAIHSAAFGLGANIGGALRATRFSVRGAMTCGVVIGANQIRGAETAVDIMTGEVSASAVGACLQVEGYDVARLSNDVAYREVGIALQATTYPLPDLLESVPP